VLLKNGFRLNYQLQKQPQFTANTVSLADDGEKSALICLDNTLSNKTVDQLLQTAKVYLPGTCIKYQCQMESSPAS